MAVALICAAVAVTPWNSRVAGAAGSAAVVCVRSGDATISPGLAVASREFTVTDVGTFGPCRLPDGSIQSATLFASGRGTGSCGSATITGQFTISWSNGQTSTGTVDVLSTGPVFVIRPKVTTGPYAGGSAFSVILPTAADPSTCLSKGLTAAHYAGVISFTAF